jgi:hypothetical protein
MGVKFLPMFEPLFALRAKKFMIRELGWPSENQSLTTPKHFIVVYSNGCINFKTGHTSPVLKYR